MQSKQRNVVRAGLQTVGTVSASVLGFLSTEGAGTARSITDAIGSIVSPGLTLVSPTRRKSEAEFEDSIVVSTTSLSDTPSQTDELGFAPYVRAVSSFLLDDNSKPPLTMSVEGSWGAGKSSFMLQLSEAILQNARQDKIPNIRCVWFNPWKNDKDEALWASFALTLLRDLRASTPIWRRAYSDLSLTVSRIETKRVSAQLLAVVLFAFVVSMLAFKDLLIGYFSAIYPKVAWDLTGTISGVVALLGGVALAKQFLGNPLPKDLKRYIRHPNYNNKLAVISAFSEDFVKIVRSYVGKKGRVFVFIDDLDRCQVPQAADLMQAINLLIAADVERALPRKGRQSNSSNLVFILGIDREMVAAGIAAKNAEVLPYLARSRQAIGASEQDMHAFGMQYGLSFLEKFIQIPFHVPHARRDRLRRWVTKLVDGPAVDLYDPEQESRLQESVEVQSGRDSYDFDEVVEKIAEAFEFNPRRTKQFVNMLRLQIAVAVQTGQLIKAEGPADDGIIEGLTVPQLAVLCAVCLQWPGFVSKAYADRNEFTQLLFEQPRPSRSIPAEFVEAREIITRLGNSFDLRNINISGMLDIFPDAFPNSAIGKGGAAGSDLTPRDPRAKSRRRNPRQSHRISA